MWNVGPKKVEAKSAFEEASDSLENLLGSRKLLNQTEYGVAYRSLCLDMP